jgi:hypothetical protein
VRQRPARLARLEAELLLQRARVDLVDDAIDVEREPRAQRRDALVERDQPVRAAHHAPLVVHRHAGRGERIEQAAVRVRQRPAAHLADAVGEEAQRPRGGDARVELAHRSRGGVAWVHEGFLPGGELLLVQSLEGVAPHVHLAAHVDELGVHAAQAQRNLADGADAVRHVLAGFAVAARGRLHQQAALVAQVDGKAVELQLRGILDGRGVVGQLQRPTHARIEAQRSALAGVALGFNGQHRHRVADRFQLRERRAQHALRG